MDESQKLDPSGPQDLPQEWPPITPVIPGVPASSGFPQPPPSTQEGVTFGGSVPPTSPPQGAEPSVPLPSIPIPGAAPIPTVGTPVEVPPSPQEVESEYEGPGKRNQVLLILILSVVALGLGAGAGLLLNRLGISLFGG